MRRLSENSVRESGVQYKFFRISATTSPWKCSENKNDSHILDGSQSADQKRDQTTRRIEFLNCTKANFQIKLDEIERDLVLMNENGRRLRKNFNEMNEFKHVLERVEQFFEVVSSFVGSVEYLTSARTRWGHARDRIYERHGVGQFLQVFRIRNVSVKQCPADTTSPSRTESRGECLVYSSVCVTLKYFRFIAGVIPAVKRSGFERVLWRACRRTAFVRISDIVFEVEDPETVRI